MDKWRFFDITHRVHTTLNPLRDEKVNQLIALLPIEPEASILDIGSGKAEVLIRLAKRHDIDAVGVDLSPPFVLTARKRVAEAGLEHSIMIVEQDGKEYVESLEGKKFDVTICMGASWIFGGYKGTLEALQSVTRDGGLVICGEPFWKGNPSEAYLKNQEISYDTFSTHEGNITVAEDLGLRPIFAMTSNEDDWEWYENRQWLGVDMHLQQFPEDPDNEGLVEKVKENRDAYLTEGRYVMGWAIYVLRKL